MAFAVTQLPGKPIVLVTVDIPLEDYGSNLRVIRAYLSHLIARTQGPLCIWFDLRNLDISFSDILIAVDEMAQAPCHPAPVHLAVIGSHPLIEVGVRRIARELSIHLERFDTLDDALSQPLPLHQHRRQTDSEQGPAHTG